MGQEAGAGLSGIAALIDRFQLTSLVPLLRSCQDLEHAGALLDVAVLGQFKSGKSSLLNALLGEEIFPVGVLPATAVITRASAGADLAVRVTYLDGSIEAIPLERLPEFVTEAGNPGNARRVAVVDVLKPGLKSLPGLRLVDTPGLGSSLAHNTQATKDWLPNVAVALVAISVERPLADEDRRLIEEARRYAPRVAVVLTKVDLLSEKERREVSDYLIRNLKENDSPELVLLPFSTRADRDHWSQNLRVTLLQPLLENLPHERQASLLHKRAELVASCRGYLELGLRAAERNDADRERLRAAVLDESVHAALIHDELRLAEERVQESVRAAFEQRFLPEQRGVSQRLCDALASELGTWTGNLARQTERFEAWMKQRLTAELSTISVAATPVADALVERAEARFRRIIEAFRDRLGRNITAATGITLSSAQWQPKRPQLRRIPIDVGRTFMTNWELIWWLLPMWLFGALFRRHIRRRIPWEVEKNFFRLTSDWTEAVNRATSALRGQAGVWVDTELSTLRGLLERQPDQMPLFREALHMLLEPLGRE